jgi:glycosyltransferase involved in cell wall biosynthesis
MKIIGVAPKLTFSGFQNTFFDSLEMQGVQVSRVAVELPVFRLLCAAASFHPNKKVWGPKLSQLYYMSVPAFKMKSSLARRLVGLSKDGAHAIYQVGSLWNPLGNGTSLPFFMQIDYTSKLSIERGGWKIGPGRQMDFRLEQERKLFDAATAILTSTENARTSVIRDYGVSPDKVVMVGAGVSAPFDRLEPDRFPDYRSKKILFIGKGDKGKGLDTLLDAFRIVRKEIADAKLTIIGPTDLSISQPGVSYLGRIVDKEQIKRIYYEHALFVMPSRFEPFGQVFLEAMSCQLPCIGTTADAMPEIIQAGVTGYNIEAGDHNGLAENMVEILNNPDRAEQMGRTGFERLGRFYTWPVVGRKILQVIKDKITTIKLSLVFAACTIKSALLLDGTMPGL